MIEFSAGMEFTFLDFDLHSMAPQMTPYLYTGISTARHKKHYFDINGAQAFDDNYNWALGIPMALGFKARAFEGLILAAEVGVRYTFSDKLDGSAHGVIKNSTDHAGSWALLPFGNLNSNDWYVFSGITLTYTFGRKPCYSDY